MPPTKSTITFKDLPDSVKKQIDTIMYTVRLKENEGVQIAAFPDVMMRGGIVLHRKHGNLHLEKGMSARTYLREIPLELKENPVWVRCAPLMDTSLSLKTILDNPILLMTTCPYHNLEQMSDSEHDQLESIIQGNVDNYEFEDDYGTDRILHTLPYAFSNVARKQSLSLDENDSPSLKWPRYMHGIVPYIQTHAHDPTRVRLLLRGSVDAMNAFQLLHRFISCMPKLHNDTNALLSLSHIDEFRSFVKDNTDIFLKDVEFVSKGDLLSTALYLWNLPYKSVKSDKQLIITGLPSQYM
jgi:hypothetical protein